MWLVKRGLEKPALGSSPALPPTSWVTQGKPLNLSGPLSLSFPSQLSVGSGSICPCFLLIEEWLGRPFPSSPGRGREAAAKDLNTEEYGVRGMARTLETRRTLTGLLQML